MKIRILGTPSVAGSSRLAGRRANVLTALLALHINRAVSIDRLIDAIWEDRPPATAREQVQNCVSLLRRSLSGGAARITISRHGPGYQMNADPDEIDAQRFERGVRAAGELHATGDLTGAVEKLREALALWSGPALDGLTGVELSAHANRLDEMRNSATERLIKMTMDLGRHDEALADLRSLTRLHPLHEQYMLLMTDNLIHRQRYAEALDAYRTFASGMAEELGVRPSRTARSRERQILQAMHAPHPPHDSRRPARSDGPERPHLRNTVRYRTSDIPAAAPTELLHHLENAVTHIQAAFWLLHNEPDSWAPDRIPAPRA
ncbi:AfsR/SARP family transcriptional regulator [Micromonospora cathayae]|uniref:AfsR/SARP family transcriptional regulator n=1 Tax=Micromonospora cathayae TaxID=3028804 RepID=A0ABY7ZUN8_9ACTN|nr:AfsR/SARP family transcriptional regulator [Micromonospora sp. HUAS 3]WDZ86766.1 AfsR/SARP family transcriptional regulator [Micromonospora sp. HUAS 3]